MKILVASHYFASHRGGVEIVAEQLCRQWAAMGHELVWVAGDDMEQLETIGGLRAVRLPVFNFVERKTGIPFPIPSLSAIRTIRARVRDAEILVLHDCLYLSNIVAFLFAAARSVPTLLVQHTRFSPRKSFLLTLIMRFSTVFITCPMLARASQVVFVSEATRNSFAKVHFRRPPITVFNGVNVDVYRPLRDGENQGDIRANYGLPRERSVVLFVGRFVEIKGLSLLRQMVRVGPEYTWVFAGWGPFDPSGWDAANVHVFSGLSGDSLATLYRASDLLVLPSVGEGFPLVIQEALASGLAVVSTTDTLSADPALEKIVTSVETRGLEDMEAAEAFLGAIHRTLSLAPTRSGSDQRRTFAVNRYSWRTSADQYLAIARSIISRSSAASAEGAAH